MRTSNWTRAWMVRDLETQIVNPMTKLRPALDADQEAHLQRILTNVTADLRAKYEAGQHEHGGNLWEKPGLLEAAIEETLDQLTYLYTLREQRDRGKIPNGRDSY